MSDFTPDKPLLKTYVLGGEQAYYVSTFERDSSASISPPRRYVHTIAWSYDRDQNNLLDIVDEDGEGQAVEQHCAMIRKLTEAKP